MTRTFNQHHNHTIEQLGLPGKQPGSSNAPPFFCRVGIWVERDRLYDWGIDDSEVFIIGASLLVEGLLTEAPMPARPSSNWSSELRETPRLLRLEYRLI